jgi:predicted MPP superfamily phosphohydrolase
MLTLICLILVLFSIAYVPHRLKKTLSTKKVFLPYVIVSFLVIAGYIVLIMSSVYTRDNSLFAILFVVLGLLLAYHIYLFLITIVLNIFTKLLPGKRGKIASIISFVLCAFIIAYGLYNSYSLKVTEHVIKVKGLTSPLTIMHAPDLHLGPSRSIGSLKKVLDEIERYKPDLVLYNGDLVDGNIALTPEIFTLFTNVSVPQYFTTGNHDFYIDTKKELEFIRSVGIKIIRNEKVDIGGINLVGLEYMNADNSANDAHRVNDLTIAEELPKIPVDHSKPTVLIHHSPVGMEYVIKEKIPVMLTGHTHGGQFFPGTLLIQFRFPKYKGRYDYEGLTLLVSQGIGTFGPPIRIGTFSEMQFVTLEPF